MKKVSWWVHLLRFIAVASILLFVVAALYPLFWMVTTAFKTYNESITWPPKFLPNNFLMDNFATVFATPFFLRYTFNTAVYSIVGTLVSVLISAMAGFAFAKYVFKGRRLLFVLVLSTMMVPSQVTLVPVFLSWAAVKKKYEKGDDGEWHAKRE
jgi:ABC-type glycerol-3-phosphate transport system permease component